MNRKDVLESTLSLLAGAGIGAGLMYLMDPDVGYRRRKSLQSAAGEMLQNTGESVGSAWESAAQQARKLSRTLSERVSEATPSASSFSSAGTMFGLGGLFGRRKGFTDRISDLMPRRSFSSQASSAAKRARGMGYDLSDRIRDTASKLARRSRSFVGRPTIRRGPSITTIVVTGVGALALGAGLMYVFDPQAGRRRRALARDKVTKAMHQTSNSLRKTSRYVSDQARGVVASTRSRFASHDVTDEQLVHRVRSQIGRVISNPRSIEVQSINHHVILRGPILRNEIDDFISTVQSIPGVIGVENQLEVHDTAGNVPGLQGSSFRQET